MRLSRLFRGTVVALAAAFSLTTSSSLSGNPTMPYGDAAYVITGAGPPILPTSSSEFNQRIQRIKPTLDELASSYAQSALSASEKREYSRAKQTNSKYPSDVERHFSYNSNDLGKNYYELVPTKGDALVSHSIQWTGSGEGRGAPRGRGLTLEPPQPTSAQQEEETRVTTLNPASAVPRGDNRNPDLREFISGFVKYLNGNVPVSNGMSKPARNRINNRGPPKISDLPAIILEPGLQPSLQPPPPPTAHDPPPYPFEKPIPTPDKHIVKPFVSGVPIPELLIPTDYPSTSIPASLRPPLRPIRPKPNDKYDNKTKDQIKVIFEDNKYHNKPFLEPIKDPVKPAPVYEPTRPTFQASSTTAEPAKNRVPPKIETADKNKTTTAQTPALEQISQAVISLSAAESISKNDLNVNPSKVIGVGVSSVVNVVEDKIRPNDSTESPASGGNVNATTTTSTTATAANATADLPATPPNATSTPTTTATEPTKTNGTTTLQTDLKTTNEPSATPNRPQVDHNKMAIPSVTRVRPAIIESSIIEEVPLRDVHKPTKWDQTSVFPKPYKGGGGGAFAPRPGIVLDDPEYKPGGGKGRPIITAPPKGEIFDVTVSAVHGVPSSTGQPVIYPVELEGVSLPGAANGEVSVITKAEEGQHFVSIDGKRTYISLFGSTETPGPVKPTAVDRSPVKPTSGFGSVHQGQVQPGSLPSGGQQQAQQRPKRPYHRRPQQPPVRIDTCIVGDWSTCDSDQHEICKTEQGVSSCHCAPGYSRHSHRQPCKRVVSVVASIQIDKIYEHKLTWNEKLRDSDSQEYLQLEYESARALESAMSMTPFSDAFMGSKLNNLYTLPGATHKPVYVNMTLQIEESPETKRPQVKQEIQKQLLGAIHRRSNNIGTSPLWAVPANSVSALQDLDECRTPELNDCHVAATCQNTFGSFECACPPGYKDEYASNPNKAGRRCETCSSEHCNHRGTCSYNKGQPVCQCAGNYYGSQCEVDGEVLGVAIGASVAAVIIILSTLACLCMWSRRWNKEQKCAGIGSPVFGYMPSGGSAVKTPGIGAPPYQVSLEDRLRWAQIADAMAQSTNHYAPEPVGMPTRPSSAMFGYNGTLPMAPMPLPRLGLRPGSAHNTTRQHDSSSEEEDRTDLLGRNFQVPRPKSRSSIANQSGIYYDVDYEQQNDHYGTTKHPGCIAMNTYTMGRSHYYRT